MADIIGPKQKETFWNILAEQAGANEGDFEDFMSHWPKCQEFRFQGHLGFGGKIYIQPDGRVYVDYYPEDRTKERDAIMFETNKRLGKVVWEYEVGISKE